jgi:hypothetical protein
MATLIRGTGKDEGQIIAEAYAHVLEGYRRALRVPGLPYGPTENLRACYRLAADIAHKPIVTTRGCDA